MKIAPANRRKGFTGRFPIKRATRSSLVAKNFLILEKLKKYRGDGLSGPIQWYHALGNLIWQDCRKIWLIESNAKCRYLKFFTCKGTLLQVFTVSVWGPLPSKFCLGWCSNFVDSESGEKQIGLLLQNMVSNTTPHPPPPSTPSQPHNVWWGKWTREKVRVTIVHQAGSKELTWLIVSIKPQ
jgi:hypothetical protein